MRGQTWALLSPLLSPVASPRPDVGPRCWTAYLAAWAGLHMDSQPPSLMDDQMQVLATCLNRNTYQARFQEVVAMMAMMACTRAHAAWYRPAPCLGHCLLMQP